MKLLTIIFCIFFSVSIFATEKVVKIDANNENREIATLPQLLMATFVDQGFKQVKISKGIFDLTIKNLRCDSNTRDVLYPDYSNAGLPSMKCYVNTKAEMGSKGKAIQESRYVAELLSRLQKNIPKFQISDCAMGGKCIWFVEKIKCTIDLNKEEMHDAYSCKFTITNY